MADGLELSLPATEAAISQARQAVESLDSLQAHPEARFVMRLLVSEVFTNAVKYGARDATIRLSVEIGETRVRAEVGDRGKGFLAEAVSMPDEDAESGRGLAFLDALAHRWGIERDGENCVWFELDL